MLGVVLLLLCGASQGGENIWLGTSTFGPVVGVPRNPQGLVATSNSKGRPPNVRAEPHRIQAESMFANPTMASPNVIIDAGGGDQMVFVNEGESFQYTVRLSHPPGSTRANDVIDDKRDTVQIWLTSSQEVMQEEAPGVFRSHMGHRTQLLIATHGPDGCTGVHTCTGTSEVRWIHNDWVVDADTGYSTSQTLVEPGGSTTQSDGEALLVFNGTNWHVPQTVTVTARQDDVFEPRTNRRGQMAYVHHHVETPEGAGDPFYHAMVVNDVSVSIEDDDPAVVLQTINDPMPTEGGLHAEISLKLASEPMANVNVTLFSGPVRHPDVPEQVLFFAVNSARPDTNFYEFTSTDWDTWRTFRVEAVDDDVDEWSYTGKFRSSEIGYQIVSDDYYYRNNGTSCLNERIGSRSSLLEVQQPHQQCVCTYEDAAQVQRYQPDQYHKRGMQCGAIATPIDNNYRFVNISLVTCTAIEGGTNCDYTIRLNSAPGFNPYDWNRDLASRVIVHLREEAEIESQSMREHELFITEWIQVELPTSNISLAVPEVAPETEPDDGDNATVASNTEICQVMNATVYPLINATCFASDGDTCSNACEGLVVPYFEQCVYINGVFGLEISEITDAAQQMLSLYRRCGGIVFDGEMIGLVWQDRTDGRGGSKTFGTSQWHSYGYEVQSGWELDLEFDHANWDIPRLISVVAFNDDVDEPDETRTIFHTTMVEERHKLDVQHSANGTTFKSDIVTNDPTYFPQNRTIEIASVAVHVVDNDVADVLLGCRSYDAETQIGSIEGYGGLEGKVPRSFRFTAGDSEPEGEMACVIHTQECQPKDKPEVKLVYDEVWYPRNLTDPNNCSEWITYQEIMDACCVDPTGGTTIDCSSGVPSTCTTACSVAFPDFYHDCWPEMNTIMQAHPNVTKQEADYFQLQCIAVGEVLTQQQFVDVGISSCLPLVDGGVDSIRTGFEAKCCADGACTIATESGGLLPDDCRPACSEFFTAKYAACHQVWEETDYHLDMGPAAGLYSAADLKAVDDVCYRYEGTEHSLDWMHSNTQLTCMVRSQGYMEWEAALTSDPNTSPDDRPQSEDVRLDDCFEGTLQGFVNLPSTNTGTTKWQIEFLSTPDSGATRDQTDYAEVTVNGITHRVYNDVVRETVFELEASTGVLNYQIEMKTGCQPDEDVMDDCRPEWSSACPCPLKTLEPQLHMKLQLGKARALSLPRSETVTVTVNGTANVTADDFDDSHLPCTLGSYTLRLNSDPGTKRIRTVRDKYSDMRRKGTIDGPAGGVSSDGDMLHDAGIPGPKGGGAPFEKVWAQAVPRIDYDYTLKPVVIEVTPDPTPHTRYETSHGGTSCKFTRANWDKECIVTAIPTMDPLLRTPWDVYWNTRQILDHTAHTVTQSFFGQMHGYADDYWNHTIPYQLFTPGPGPHGQDIGQVPTGSDSPIMEGDHLSENAQEFCTIRKGAYEEERYTKDGPSGAFGDKSAHAPGVYDEVVCRWGGRRTHTEGTSYKYGPYILWNHTLYRHPIQVRYVMINTYDLPQGGNFGAAISSVPQSDPLLSFRKPTAGSLRDLAFGPRIEDVSDARRCANLCNKQPGCNSFDFAPQQYRCYLNAGFIPEQGAVVMVDDQLPAGMQQLDEEGQLRAGTISTVALSQAYYHHYRRLQEPLPEAVSVDNVTSACELGPHNPSNGTGSPNTERSGFKYRATALPDHSFSHDGGASFCGAQCCKDSDACVAWVVRPPTITANCTGPMNTSDNCAGTKMGTCTAGMPQCCFLVAADATAVPRAGAPVPAEGSLSGGVMQEQLWAGVRGFNYMATYAVNAIELWRDYDYYAIERELAVAQRGGFNLVRVPLSYEVWAHNSTLYSLRLQHFVETAYSRGMRVVPVIFDMRAHPNAPRCTLHTVDPLHIEDTRKCWYPSPGYVHSDDLGWWVNDGKDYLDWLAAELHYELSSSSNATDSRPGIFLWDVVNAPEDYPAPRPDPRPNMPRRPAAVPSVANASTIVGESVSGPGSSYSVPTGEQAWENHTWTFVQYMTLHMRNVSDVPLTVSLQSVENFHRVAPWVDVLAFQTVGSLQQPTPPTPHPTHTGSAGAAGETPSEQEWGQMGQPSGSSSSQLGNGQQGFNVKGSTQDMWGRTDGLARKTVTQRAHATATELGMPVFNSRSGCADRGWNANPFDQPVEPTRYNTLPNYMWDHMMSGMADCVAGCDDATGGCVARSV